MSKKETNIFYDGIKIFSLILIMSSVFMYQLNIIGPFILFTIIFASFAGFVGAELDKNKK